MFHFLSPAARTGPHSGLPSRLALAVAVGLAALAAGCTTRDFSTHAGNAATLGTRGNPYPAKGDADPHEGVARAHRMPVQGIDISRWQGDIDWNAVKAAGTRFAFIKATEGGDHIDPKFLENWHGAARAGVRRAAYHFVYWCRPSHQQAMWFFLNVPRDPDALPPVLDVEWNGHSRTCPRTVPPEQARAMMHELLVAMEAHTGKRPIIYTDIPFHRDVLSNGEFSEYPFWIRSTAAEPREVYDDRLWSFWQFTTTGRIPGIKGDVDRNAFAGSPEQWERFVSGSPNLIATR